MISFQFGLHDLGFDTGEFCIENDGLFVKHDEFCIENDELFVKNDEFCIENDRAHQRGAVADCNTYANFRLNFRLNFLSKMRRQLPLFPENDGFSIEKRPLFFQMEGTPRC